jgi:UPF0755 protein
MKRLVPVCGILLLLIAVGMLGFWQQYQKFVKTPLQVGETGHVIVVQPGSSIRSVLSALAQQDVTDLDWRWRLLNRLQHKTIKAGEYKLVAGILPVQLLDLLASGKVISYGFTIVEGWTVKQLLVALGKDPVLQHTLETVADLEKLDGLPSGNPEGWFLPETYVFVRGDSDLQILRRAYRDMQDFLASAWAGRDSGLPYETQNELLTMASIVEKETSLGSERFEIAGVFVRRLIRRWRLETDPTVIYGMGETYKGDIRRRDLKTDTAYNTYTRHGLPPTPIALPGPASIEAAAHPAGGDAMFFVANGQGGHTFSRTLEEHNEAVRQLLIRGKKDPADQNTGEKQQ